MKKEISASVIIPVRNSEKYIGACLESVLNQDFENFEVIAVDNNSTDQTKEIILELAKKHKNLKYLFEPKIARGAARNTGEKIAQGKIILMTDSDCFMPKNWIREMTEPIEKGLALAVQGSEKAANDNYWSRQIDLRVAEKIVAYEQKSTIIKVDTKNFAILRQTLEKIGFTDRRYVSGNDTDLTIRLLKNNIVPLFKKDIKVQHLHIDSFNSLVRKQFYRAFWCQRISANHYFFLYKTNFLFGTDQIRRPFRDSLKKLRKTLTEKGLSYLFFDLIAMISWRRGLAYSIYKAKKESNDNDDKKQYKKTVTVLFPIRNLYDYRIRNSLKSIRNQIYEQSLIKIIIIDYGSEEKYKKNFDELCRLFDARGIWTGFQNKAWNRSKCINIGLKEVDTEYVIITNADAIFANNYIQTCVRIGENLTVKFALFPDVFDCPMRLINAKTDVSKEFGKLARKSKYLRSTIYKNKFPHSLEILFTDTKTLKEIGGYDEFYSIETMEELDIFNRLQTLGFEILNVSNYTKVLHQWRPEKNKFTDNNESENEIKFNKQYCENNFSVIRNVSRKSTQLPTTLNGSFWGITSFFNPAQYKNKYENYKIFRNESKKQGLKLIVVELAYGNNSFEIKETDTDLLIQIRGNEKNILWQKELLLEIGLKHLPTDCDKVAWIDCDIIFDNNNWIKETSDLLEKYKVVQPFHTVIRMEEGVKSIAEHKNFVIENGEADRIMSFSAAWQLFADQIISTEFKKFTPGYVCAFRRETIEKIGFYKSAILGMSDSVMIKSFFGLYHLKAFNFSDNMKKNMNIWSINAYEEVQNSAFFTDGNIFHLWHGTIQDRKYFSREKILEISNFDPNTDITINKDGILEWTTNNEELKIAVAEYFWDRKEEGKNKKKPELDINKKTTDNTGHNLKPKRSIKLKLIFLKRKLAKIVSYDLKEEYHRMLGLVGQRIKSKNKKLYLQLKKYFPDKN